MKRLLTFIGFAALLWMPQVTQAYSVAPATIELEGARGEVVETSFTLINDKSAEQTLYLDSVTFEPRGEGGKPAFLTSEEEKTGFPAWIKFPARSVLIPANSFAEVPVTIAIPSDVASGGHYAAFTISTAPSDVVETNGATIQAKTAILVFLTIEGETVEHAELLDFTSSIAGASVSRIQGAFQYRVQNQGNVHVTPEATLRITDVFGREVLSVNANEAAGRVLPGSTRTYEGTFGNAEEMPGFVSHVRAQVQPLAIGPMTATLEVTHGEDVNSRSFRFWLIPWQLLSVVFLGALLVLVCLFFWKTRRK